jgi:hypothetical protein
MTWLLIGYMWLFVHRPFEIWPWLATYRIERVYMIATIVCWLFSGPKFPARNRLHIYFTLFILVMIASWLLSPYQAVGGKTVENYLKYAVFYVLLITSVRNERDLRGIIAGYVGVMTLMMAHSLREYYCGRVAWAQGIKRMSAVNNSYDPNDFAGLIVCCLPFVWVLWHEWKERWKRLLLLGVLGLACYCIMLTGSRMGFCGLVLASLLACMVSPRRWRLLAAYPVLAAAAWMAMPQDRQDRVLTLIDPSKGPTNATGSAGHWRLSGLENAWPLFEERPLLGFGPLGFLAIKGAMPHNLYGQLLAELGLAGAIAFGLILLGVAQNLWEARRIAQGVSPPSDVSLAWHTVAAMGASVLLLAIMGWGFNFLFWHVWLWFGGFQAVALSCLKQQAESAELGEVFEPDMPIGILEGKCS